MKNTAKATKVINILILSLTLIRDDFNLELTSDYSRILARIVLNPHNLQVTLNFVKNSDSSIVLLYFGTMLKILIFQSFQSFTNFCLHLWQPVMTSQSAVPIKLSARLKSAKVAKAKTRHFWKKFENWSWSAFQNDINHATNCKYFYR